MAVARNALVVGALAVPLLAAAGGGQIDSFSSSAVSVVEGSTVDFFASVGIFTSAFSDGGSDLFEPQPMEGTQTCCSTGIGPSRRRCVSSSSTPEGGALWICPRCRRGRATATAGASP